MLPSSFMFFQHIWLSIFVFLFGWAQLITHEAWLFFRVDPSHVYPGDSRDNFWDMGDTGPCGPCTEIYYVHDDPEPKDTGWLQNNLKAVELWNVVFMQYDR